MAKQYKTSDILEELENDHVTKFKLVGGCKRLNNIGIMANNNDGYLSFKDPNNQEGFDAIDLNNMKAIFLHGIWEKVEKSVDFMTASNSGKELKPEKLIESVDVFRKGLTEFQSLTDVLNDLSYYTNTIAKSLINSLWLIKED